MSFILQPDIVRYSCSCGSLNSLSKLYFCRHCLKLRCGYCVCHEVDSSYCSNCLENIPSAEARLKKNRCATCYDCPSCFHTVSVRAVTVTSQSVEDAAKTVSKKFYYMACSFCRWTSRDAGISDQTAASGAWPERENPHAARVASLIDFYKVLGAKERLDKERKKFVPRLTRTSMPMYLDERLGMNLSTARKRAGLPPRPSMVPRGAVTFPVMVPAEASEEVEPLPASYFTDTPDLLAITTLAQRLAEPDCQPALVSQLMPAHKHLFIKRSQRCRSCEHNVSKPEFNPASIKFKIQLSAYYHVPEVRVFTCEPLRLNSKSELILKLLNPTQNVTTVEFLAMQTEMTEIVETETLVEQGGGDMTSAMHRLSLAQQNRSRLSGVSAELVLPSCAVVLPQRDDAAEYDDTGEAPAFHDDPKVVTWRKGNKAMVKMAVTPTLESQRDVTVAFTLAFTYTNTMTPLGGEKERQKTRLQVPIYLKIGRLVGNK